MRNSEALKRLVAGPIATAFAAALSGVYSYAMLIHPWIQGGMSWIYVQEVWDRWQSFNVGILAFVSTVIAFRIAKYNANEQRAREFTASIAFLPATLSSLSNYFSNSAIFLTTAAKSFTPTAAPIPPAEYRTVFSECIRHALPNVGAALSKILVLMQIHEARLKDVATNGSVDMHNLIVYLYRLGELQVRVNKLFDFSRNKSKFDGSHVEWDDLNNAYSIFNLDPSDYQIDEKMNLEAFSKRALKRESD